MSNPKRELELETAESTATRLTTELSTFASLDEARRAVARIGLACRSWGDEETNVALARDLERLLQSYPACVVREIADPVSGIARRHKFMPVLAEVAEFADRLVDQRRAELRFPARLRLASRPPRFAHQPDRSRLCENRLDVRPSILLT
jgi:hypothetical protein